MGYDVKKVIAHLDALGLDRACVLTWELVNGLEPWGYQHLSFQEMWEACKRYPDRLVPFYAPDPRRPDAERALREAIKKGLKGFGECKLRMCLDEPDLVKLFRIAGDAGLPVLLHLTKAMPPRNPTSTSVWPRPGSGKPAPPAKSPRRTCVPV
ncbi:MAG: hypothetical protein ABSA30_12685 [Candidatus Aminicenantales bacterium]